MDSKVVKIVNERLLKMMDGGTIPWHKPWKVSGLRPQNMIHRWPYSGVNAWLTSGMPSPFWLTFKQVQQLGAHIREGEHGTMIVYWSKPKPKGEEDEDDKKRPFFLRYYLVWNISQIEGIPEDKIPPLPHFEELPESDKEDKASMMLGEYLANGGPALAFYGDHACYSPSNDLITTPERKQFESVEGYWSTLFHEAAHSTGVERRCNRDTFKKFAPFGSKDYAREELVAEIAAAYMTMEAGLEPNIKNTAAYLQNWMEACEKDPLLFVTAATRAEAAVEFMLGVESKCKAEEPAEETVA